MLSAGDRLFELFKELPDVYPDFVRFVPSIAESEGLADELLEHMLRTPGMTTSDVLEWISEEAGWEHD